MRINDKETLALADAAKSVMAENAKDYKPNRGGKGHDDFIDLHSIDKEKRRGSSPLTEKDIEEANEFTKAAAKAAVAGDDEFEFDGKTYPAEMDVDVAKKILGESVSINEAIDFSKVKDDQLKAWLDRFRSTKGNPWDGFKDDVKAAEKEAKKRGLDEAVVYQQNLPQILKKVETYLEFIEKPLSVGSKANKMVNRDLGGNYNKEFKKMEDALDVIFSEMDEIAMAYAMSESVELDESVNDIAKKVKQLKVGDKTNFGVVTAISNKSITFKAKDTPKTEIEFKQRKIGSRDFILDKLVKLTPDGKGVAKESAELEEALDAADGAMKGIKAKERLNYIDIIVSTYEGKDLNWYKKALFKNPRFKDKKLTPYELKVLKQAMKESTDLEEAKMWTVTITKKAGKLSKGQTVDVKANNSAQAIEKGLTQMKVNPKLVPSNAVDATLAEELEEAKIAGKDRERLDDLISLYISATSPEADYYYDDDVPDYEKILKDIEKEFGSKIAKDVSKGTNIFHYGRDDNQGASLTYGDATKHRGARRITKSGKINKQDAAALKKNIRDILKNTKLNTAYRSHKLKGKLPESNTNLEEASNADLKKVLATAKKIGGRVKGNTADFGMGAVIDFSIEKGKIKFDGGKSSGIEYFDNVNDAISSLTAGLD